MPLWMVVLKSSHMFDSRTKIEVTYIIHALNEDIARDACMRQHAVLFPRASAEVMTAYVVDLCEPLRIATESDDN